MADIFRTYGDAYRATHALSGAQLRVMRAIEQCRTPALGGQILQCDHCGACEARYHSCRNRHCPKCQPLAKARWVEARLADLLPIPYFHCVFTLPHSLNPVAQGNPRVLYPLLFQAAWDTLATFGWDARWLGGALGATMVLHTWGQNLDQHLHVHCLVTGGALAAAEDRWIPTPRRQFLFPVKALSKVFRGKYLDRIGNFICRVPGRPRGSRGSEESEGARVKANAGWTTRVSRGTTAAPQKYHHPNSV